MFVAKKTLHNRRIDKLLTELPDCQLALSSAVNDTDAPVEVHPYALDLYLRRHDHAIGTRESNTFADASSSDVGSSNSFSMKSNIAGETSNENVSPFSEFLVRTRSQRMPCGAAIKCSLLAIPASLA